MKNIMELVKELATGGRSTFFLFKTMSSLETFSGHLRRRRTFSRIPGNGSDMSRYQ
jgi:hypothetical protein